MNPLLIGALTFVALIVLLCLRVPIAVSMLIVGSGGLLLTKGATLAFYSLSTTPASALMSFSMCTIPLFILMGNLCNEAGLTSQLYDAGNKVLGRLPGGLAAATVFCCAGFAATTGSSVGMVAAMTRIALPEMDRYGYDRDLSLGTIAGSGTLGILIPPSIPMVMYAIATEQSVGRILLGGIFPGIIMAVAMIGYVTIRCKLHPEQAPLSKETYTFKEKMVALKDAWTILALFIIVIGSIYAGIASATEAGAVGCLGALLIAFFKKRLTWKAFKSAMLDTIKMTCMILLISMAANVFQLFLTRVGFATAFTNLFVNAHMSKTLMVIILLLVYIPLGMFFDTMGMILLTIPIFYPVMQAVGIDPIWFGVMVIIMIQISLLSPSVGLNVYVLKGCVADSTLGQIFKSCVPWMILELAVVALLIAFPGIILWLPNMMH